MEHTHIDTIRKNKIVAYWLLIGVFMIIIQVLLGGITRLSGSGLSITEWDIVTGALPPLNHEQWLVEYGKYKLSPQYQYLNEGFTLSQFKSIFFWEWFHRLWARILGFVFLIPFVYFIIKKYLNKDMIWPIAGMFILGALQGAIGWIMVASGLVGDAIYVRPSKLALHFVLAMLLGCYVLWFALSLLIPNEQRLSKPAARNFMIFILLLLFVQLTYGALMAGHKAAPVAATWPKINADWIPEKMNQSPTGHYLLENKLTIHFIHRTLAYLIFVLVTIFSFWIYRFESTKVLRKFRLWPFILVSLQVVLGVLTVISSTTIKANQWSIFETIAESHQLIAMLLMMSMVIQIYILGKKRA